MQGLGIGEAAFQNAVIYARDRVQMRALSGAKRPELAADPIIVHPDVRRMLLTGKAYSEAGHAATWLAIATGYRKKSTDELARQEAGEMVALLTPIAKAFMTDNGSIIANLSQQVYGGHGFIREWGMEQYVRDVRISQIHEGTNGIQALDLIGRKGSCWIKARNCASSPSRSTVPAKRTKTTRQMKESVEPIATLMKELGDITMQIGMQSMMNKDEAGSAAVDFRACWATWCSVTAQMVKGIAGQGPGDDAKFYKSKIATARFYFARLFTETATLKLNLKSGAKAVMEIEEDAFVF